MLMTDPPHLRVRSRSPEGFTNTGLTCFRPDHTYRAPSHLASCGCGGSNAGLSCYYGESAGGDSHDGAQAGPGAAL